LRGDYLVVDGIDGIDKELDNYQKSFDEERKKIRRNNIIIFIVLIIVILAFVYALWRYQSLHLL
jgi:hypothetical protein